MVMVKVLVFSIFLALAVGEDNFAPRIVGGDDAMVGEFPWLVWLGKDNKLKCHGSLIREDLVLTSKTCSDVLKKLDKSYAYIGDGNRNTENVNNPSQKIRIVSRKEIDDLVILKLKTPADISLNAVKNVDVVQTATKEEENEIIGNKLQCIIAGWGQKAQPNGKNLISSPRIQKLEIQFTKKVSACKRVKGFNKKTELCYKVSGKEGPCDFDDGAPITCKLGSNWLLVGVDTGKGSKKRSSKNPNKRCRGGQVTPIRVSAFYNDIQKRIDDVFGDASTPSYPADCTEARKTGQCDGPFNCDLSVPVPYGYKDITVSCDQNTDGGGWTVIQRRSNGGVDFYRKFRNYEFGFGSASDEYWLGLKWIQALTMNGNTEMRIDLRNEKNEVAYQVFQDFSLGRARGYQLNVGPSNGTAGDNGGFELDNGSLFSTYDNDQDSSEGNNLAEMFHTGWWLPNASGSFVNLNGDYGVPGTINVEHTPPGGFTHIPWNGLKMLKYSTIMVRKPIT